MCSVIGDIVSLFSDIGCIVSLFSDIGIVSLFSDVGIVSLMIINNNNSNEMLIKREPLVYTRARHAVQRKKEKKKARTV